ncbi:MAG: tyrosine-protein phosphatase [Haloechinothrix sp.]
MKLLSRRPFLTALTCVGLTIAAPMSVPAIANPAPIAAASAPAAPAYALLRDATAERNADGTYTLTWDAKPAVADVDVFASTDPAQQGQHLAMTSGERIVLSGLDPDRRWYFELVPSGQERGLPVATRDLGLAGVPNARDIGGYRARNGRVVQWGSVFRTDTLSGATDGDVTKLTQLGLDQVIDFRSPAEIRSQGSDRLPEGARQVLRPIYDPDNDFFVEVSRIIGSGDPELQREALADGAAERLLIRENRMYASDAEARRHIGAVLRDLAESGDPLLYHCTAGKDRTGWITAVILTTLGVARETIFADYLLSNHYRRAYNEKTMAYLQERGLMTEPELLLPLLEVRREYLDAAFDEVDRRYGSFANYLQRGLGIDPLTQRALRDRLLVR